MKRTQLERKTEMKRGKSMKRNDLLPPVVDHCRVPGLLWQAPRTPVRKKRKGPARRGRVIDRDRLKWAATQPCQITDEFPATTHHVRFCGFPKDDTRIIRLVDRLHMIGSRDGGAVCVEDGKKPFEQFHGVEIERLVSELQQRYERFKGETA